MSIAAALEFLTELSRIELSPLITNHDQLTVGFHSSCISKNDGVLGSGWGRTREEAQLIALAESVERKIVTNLSANDAREVELDKFPSTAGFCVGTELGSTTYRALAEGLERWLRSQWIDFKCYLQPKHLPVDASNVVEVLRQHFESVEVYSTTHHFESHWFHSIIVIGYTDNGAFVGSKTGSDPQRALEHALIEAWRHLQIATREESRHFDRREFKVIKYFAHNKNDARRQIPTIPKEFPTPRLRLLKQVPAIPGWFCVRAICEDHIGWSDGPIERFVY